MEQEEKQVYMQKRLEELYNAIEKIDLGDLLEAKANEYIAMLNDDTIDQERKYQLLVLVEDFLAKIRDFPLKGSHI